METIDLVRQFVKSNLAVLDEKPSLNDNDRIFELGYVDSFFAVQLVDHLEQQFGINIEENDLDVENFSSIDRISEFVKIKKGKADDSQS